MLSCSVKDTSTTMTEVQFTEFKGRRDKFCLDNEGDHKKKTTLKFKEQFLKQRQRKTFQTKEQHLKMAISMQWLQVQSV